MACMVQDALDRLAALLDGLTVTLADGTVVSAVGPRQGLGGNIPETPFLEVGSRGVDIEEQGVGCKVLLRAEVMASVRYGGDVARETETLNRLFCAVRSVIKADPTLGGLVESARAVGSDVMMLEAEGREFWTMIVRVEVIYREC